MSYEVRGMRENLTSYDNSSVGSGSIVNDVEFAYNDFSQLTHDYQAHGGAVNTSTSPKVQYGYASGSANTVRPTSMTYPDGRVLNYDYAATNGIDDAASRIASLIDDDLSATHLVDYSYLGVGRAANSVNSPIGSGFVIADYTQPEIKWTMADLSGSNDPDTGDIYTGFDRFSRVKDNRWYGYGSLTDVDRIKYGYDRSSNRIWRQNTVADALSKHFDELYSNDGIQRLKDLERGTLNAQKDAVTDETFAECWSLDPTGNWKKYLQDDDGDGTWDLNQSRTANDVNEITDITETTGPSWITPAYSKAGNMTTIPQPADPTNSYTATYDAWNRLVKLVDGANTVSEYEYDGAKRRTVQKNYVSGILDETRHLYCTDPSKWQVIEERVDSSTDPEQQNIWGLRYIDDCVLRDRDTNDNGTLDERLYAMQDANWNVTALSYTSGTIQERYAYSAYGTPMFLTPSFGSRTASSFAWETLYCSYRWETRTELFHVRNRVLNSSIGLWSQRDSESYIDSMNLMEYVLSGPLNRIDPLGMWFCAPADWIDNNPPVERALKCFCGLMQILDLLPPAAGPLLGALGRIGGIADCLCNGFESYVSCCKCRRGNAINVFGCILSIGTTGADCALEMIAGQLTLIQQIATLILELGIQLTDWLANVLADPNVQVPPGVLACFS